MELMLAANVLSMRPICTNASALTGPSHFSAENDGGPGIEFLSIFVCIRIEEIKYMNVFMFK